MYSISCGLARQQRDAWTAHLRRSYPPAEADALLAAWAGEDVYVPLEAEIMLLAESGFGVEVIWRKESFAVLAAWPRPTRLP